MNKQFKLLEFIFNSVYADLKYNEIYLMCIAGYVCLSGVCSNVVVLRLGGCFGTLCGGCGDCDACAIVCVVC